MEVASRHGNMQAWMSGEKFCMQIGVWELSVYRFYLNHEPGRYDNGERVNGKSEILSKEEL